ncbi:MAG: nucleoside deaminase, partial [Synergistaceae bacterium]|nr:nucleoside deaminase [Synergistaceae bacterium]
MDILSDSGHDDFFFMEEALVEARNALSLGEIPVGAVVVKGGLIVGRGANSRDSLVMPFSHAEMRALHEACRTLGAARFDGCSIYTTLEPCPMCAGAIVQTRVSRLVYGATDSMAGAAGTLYDIPRDPRMAHRCDVTGGILAAESKELLGEFFRS